MGSISIRCLSKHCFLRLRERHFLNEASVFSEDFLRNKQQFRFYSWSHSQLNKIGNPNTNSHSLPRYLSSSPSTSESTKSSRVGFLKWYLGKLDSHPLITKSLTASIIYAAADITSQMITSSPSGTYDTMRTLRMAGYGLLLLGPSQHFWFNFMSKVLPRRDLLTTLKKIFMGQAIYGPCSTTVFFSYNAGLQGESSSEIVGRLKRDLLPTLKNGVFYCPVCDFVTYKFIPVHLQPLVNSSCAYLWTIYLTYMASLKKVSD